MKDMIDDKQESKIEPICPKPNEDNNATPEKNSTSRREPMKKYVKYSLVGIMLLSAILIIIGLFIETTKIFYIIAAILCGGLAIGTVICHFLTRPKK